MHKTTQETRLEEAQTLYFRYSRAAGSRTSDSALTLRSLVHRIHSLIQIRYSRRSQIVNSRQLRRALVPIITILKQRLLAKRPTPRMQPLIHSCDTNLNNNSNSSRDLEVILVISCADPASDKVITSTGLHHQRHSSEFAPCLAMRTVHYITLINNSKVQLITGRQPPQANF